jgi:hypothetical protein
MYIYAGNNLRFLLKLLTESTCLAKYCERREAVTRECTFITDVLDEATQEYYDRWAAAALIGDWEARLRRPLLTNSPVVAGAIETTLSRHVKCIANIIDKICRLDTDIFLIVMKYLR